MRPFYNWVKEKRKHHWRRLISNGELEFNAEATKKWMILIREEIGEGRISLKFL